MRHPFVFSRHVGSVGMAALLAAVSVSACSHPAAPMGGTGNSQGNGSGGGNGNGSGGNSSGNGSGGNSNGNGSGGSGSGSGGTGEVIITGSGGSQGSGDGGVDSGEGNPGSGGATVTKMSCADTTYMDMFTPGYTPDPAVKTQVTSLLNQMSIADKAGQMRGVDPGTGSNYSDVFRQPDNMGRGIKGFLFRDGPRGVNLDAPLPTGSSHAKSTVFPVAMARGASFDLDLEYRIGQAIGDEMVASGQTMMLAPTVNILRHPLWGRAQETYGEDVFLLGRLGAASVVGIQEYVPACVKHYAANNIENKRSNQNAIMDEQTLREVYGRHFEMIVKEAGVACVMAAYNQVNGVSSTQNKHLLNDILRTDFGFKGFVLSDWWAMPGGSSLAGTSTDQRKKNAAEAIKAGMDMELPWGFNYGQIESITGGGMSLSDADINTAVSRILEQKIRFKVNSMSGSIGLKQKAATTSFSNGNVSSQPHVDLALEAAIKSMVLLKNDNNTLPIKKGGTVKSIAVVGAKLSYAGTPGINNPSDDPNGGMVDFATSIRTGDCGSSRANADPAKSTSPFSGIQKVAAAVGGGITVTSGNDANAAKNADFVVVVAGLTPYDEGEEYNNSGDRTSFALDGKLSAGTQNKLIMDVAALGKPFVVVLEGGSVIDMPWISNAPAVVMAWYPGMAGGEALGKLLFGEANFSAKLPITWPKTGGLTDPGTFSSGTATMMDYYLGYRRYDQKDIAPQFPFGHGLSYTTFKYSNLQVPCTDVTKNGVVNVTVDVQNTGTVAGDEIAMLFVQYPSGSKRRSDLSPNYKELKGFYRVSLMPGMGKRITIPLRVQDLKYYDGTAWQVETGTMKVLVGPNAGKSALMLSDTFTVK